MIGLGIGLRTRNRRRSIPDIAWILGATVALSYNWLDGAQWIDAGIWKD